MVSSRDVFNSHDLTGDGISRTGKGGITKAFGSVVGSGETVVTGSMAIAGEETATQIKTNKKMMNEYFFT